MKKLNRTDLPTASDLLKNELDLKVSNDFKNTPVSHSNNHIEKENPNLFQSVKDADDVIFLSNESN